MSNKDKDGSNWYIALGVVLSFCAALITTVSVLLYKIQKKMEKNAEHNNLMHTIFFNNGAVQVGEDVDYAYLSCLFGNMDAAFSAFAGKRIQVEIFNCFGNMKFVIPEGVHVVYAAEDTCANLVDEILDEVKEEEPVVYITGKNIFGNVILSR